MICILLDPNSGVLKIFDPITKKDLSDQFQVNQMAIQTKDGKWSGGWHVGQDITEKVAEAEDEAQKQALQDQSSEPQDEKLLGGNSEPTDRPEGGRYGRG